VTGHTQLLGKPDILCIIVPEIAGHSNALVVHHNRLAQSVP